MNHEQSLSADQLVREQPIKTNKQVHSGSANCATQRGEALRDGGQGTNGHVQFGPARDEIKAR